MPSAKPDRSRSAGHLPSWHRLSAPTPSPAGRPAPAPSPTPPAPTPPGTASPSPYHKPPATPLPSPHQARPPGNIMTSNNMPPGKPPRPLKLLFSGKPDTSGPVCSRADHPIFRIHDRYIRRSALPYVQPGDRPPDDHPLDLQRPRCMSISDRPASGFRSWYGRTPEKARARPGRGTCAGPATLPGLRPVEIGRGYRRPVEALPAVILPGRLRSGLPPRRTGS
jgi:hypothetical protein